MIIRIIIILLIFYWHKEIINFFYSKKFEKIKKKFTNFQNNIENNDINIIKNKIKLIDKLTYKYINKRLKIILNIYNNIKKKGNVNKNEYEIIKLERKNILNKITVLKESIDKKEILTKINNYIMIIINRVLDYRKKYDINWFEDESLINGNIIIEPYDSNINYNYDIY